MTGKLLKDLRVFCKLSEEEASARLNLSLEDYRRLEKKQMDITDDIRFLAHKFIAVSYLVIDPKNPC